MPARHQAVVRPGSGLSGQGATMQTTPSTPDASAAAPSRARQMLNKVPEVTLYFWVIKVLCTTVGETASDYLSDNVGLGLTKTTFLTGALLIVALVFQFRVSRYIPYDLLARDRADQRRRHADHRQPLRQLRRLARRHHGHVFDRARARVRGLVGQRAHPLDPHDLHDPARGVLLARRPVHVRPRHRRR